MHPSTKGLIEANFENYRFTKASILGCPNFGQQISDGLRGKIPRFKTITAPILKNGACCMFSTT